MPSLRRHRLLLAAALLGAGAACEPVERPALAGHLERSLERGRTYAAVLVAHGRTATEVGAEAALALGYLERLRLGLGSPFRLIEYALKDTRLDAPTRSRIAWALLARTLDGQSYDVAPAGLDRIGIPGHLARPGVGRHHLELIEGAITAARDPRGGELAVRLAYALAAAERSVSERGPKLAAHAAALIRDRELARTDALRLLQAAEESGTSPLDLLPAWRRELRFAVEQPPVTPLPLAVERGAMELAPRLAGAIRSLGLRIAAGLPAPPRDGSRPLLGAAAARRLAELADALDSPPQTPVIVAVDVHHRELLRAGGPDESERAARRRFAHRARNEESFAAEYALLAHRQGGVRPVAARTALGAAVGLRTYAQESVWYPGFGGPSIRELEGRFGLTAIEFDPDIPGGWRPYYRRMLAVSLADLQRVLPALDVSGLRVLFGEGQGRSATLALHDPTHRRIFLPPATAAGTIAHEVAHDLDWQIALRRYRVRGDYGSDRATRLDRGRLAAALRGLTTTVLIPPEPGDSSAPMHARRPAEVFARSIDWFVVVSLAREGRMNGYLSSVQDDLLTGYGTVTPPDVTGTAGQALIDILDEVAPVYAGTRRWFLENYGPSRALSAYDLVRTVLEAPVPASDELILSADAVAAERPSIRTVADTFTSSDVSAAADATVLPTMIAAALRFAAVKDARATAFAAIDAWVCQAPAAAYDPGLETTRRRLVAVAAGARARGIALEHADAIAGEAGRRWMARRFYGAPWPSVEVAESVVPLLATIADHAGTLGMVEISNAGRGFRLAAAPGYCSAAPLLTVAD